MASHARLSGRPYDAIRRPVTLNAYQPVCPTGLPSFPQSTGFRWLPRPGLRAAEQRPTAPAAGVRIRQATLPKENMFPITQSVPAGAAAWILDVDCARLDSHTALFFAGTPFVPATAGHERKAG